MLMGLLRRAVDRDPAKIAVVYGEQRIRYDTLLQRTQRCAAGLRRLGVGPGDCVAMVLRNCPEFLVAFFASASLRAVILPLNPDYSQEEIQRLLSDTKPKAIIASGERLALCREIATRQHSGIPVVAVESELAGTIAFASLLDGLGPEIDAAAEPYRGRAFYLYTSGSTDSFKRVCCTQENLFYEAHNFVASTGISADDTILCTIPLGHSYGLGNCLLDAVYTGATLVIEPDTATPFAARHGRMLELLRAEQVRIYPGVPFQYEVLAASTEDVRAAFRDVAWCLSSGDVLPKRTFDRFRARTGHPIRSLYGSTEAGSIAMDCGPAAEVEFGSLGLPLENVTIEVRGKTGQIWVKSPVIPPDGYDDRAASNAEIFRAGFYNTGDVGKLDPRGRLVLTGRKQSFFDVGGHKVDLGEVEEVLLAAPDVREAAVVGVEIPGLGGAIKAVVAAHEACRETDILDHCRRYLAAFKVPRFVEFREMLPRSPLGKILRKELSDPTPWLIDVPSARELPRALRNQQVDWLVERIRDQVAAILGGEPAQVPRDVPFQSLGFDSLRTVELQERLSRMSGVALSVITLWNYPSIDAYASYLLDAMRGAAAAPPPVAADPLDGYSEDEIAAMLARELDGANP
jgi:long-chain acyl-CoA synthetase